MMVKHYWLIKSGQLKKKFRLYKLAFSVLFNFTYFFYLLALFGYIGFAIIAEGDFSSQPFNFEKIEAFTDRNIWSIAIIFPLIYLFRTMNDPGITFSTAEYTLMHLPISRKGIWFMRALERWIIVLLQFSVIGMGLLFITNATVATIIFYVSLIVLINVLMTVIGWKFFQLHLLKKILIVFLYACLVIGLIFLDSYYISIGLLVVIGIINVFLLPKLFTNINWLKVRSASDFRLWNMAIVGNVSKVRMTKPGKNSPFRILSSWQRPFPYNKSSVYHRLWLLYFEKNFIVMLQLFGGLFLVSGVLIFIKEEFFMALLAVAIIAITSVAGSMFTDRLESDVVHVLPWDLTAFKNTFIIWIVGFSAVFVIPMTIYAFVHEIYLYPVQLFIAVVALIFSLEGKLGKIFFRLDNDLVKNELLDTGAFVLLIILGFANVSPRLLIPGVVIAVWMVVFKGRSQYNKQKT